MTQPARVSGGSATGETANSATTVSGSFDISSGTGRALFITASRELAGSEAALTPTSVVITGESTEASLVVDEFCNDSTDVKVGLYVIWDADLPANGSYTVTVTYPGSSSTAQSVIIDLWEYVKQNTVPSGAQIDADNDPGNPTSLDMTVTTAAGVTNHLILCACVEGSGNQWDDPIEPGFTNIAQSASGSQSDTVLAYQVDTGGGGDSINITPVLYLGFGANRMAGVAASFEEYVAPSGTTHDVSVSEAVDVGETVSVSAVYETTLSDSVTISGSNSTAVDFEVTVSYPISINDVQAVAAVFQVSVFESVVTAAALSAQCDFDTSITHGVEIADARSVTAIYEVSITPGVGVGDSENYETGVFGNIVDGVGASVSFSAQCIYNATVAESIAVGDQAQVATVFEVTLPNGVTISEAEQVQAILNATVAEGVTVNDIIQGALQGAVFYGDRHRIVLADGRIKIVVKDKPGKVVIHNKPGKNII